MAYQKTTQQGNSGPAPGERQLPPITGTRLIYPAAVEALYDLNEAKWRTLCDATFPAAKTPEAILLALDYCKHRNLDVFKKVVHIVPMWSTALGRMVETVWPGIAELRTTAARTGEYAGKDETVFGPDVDHEFKNPQGLTIHTLTIPLWAQTTVYRFVKGEARRFVGDKTFWLENYATAKRDTTRPNEMWNDRPYGQLAKVSEANALRIAFPEDIGHEMSMEEMAGKVIFDAQSDESDRFVRALRPRPQDFALEAPKEEPLPDALQGLQDGREPEPVTAATEDGQAPQAAQGARQAPLPDDQDGGEGADLLDDGEGQPEFAVQFVPNMDDPCTYYLPRELTPYLKAVKDEMAKLEAYGEEALKEFDTQNDEAMTLLNDRLQPVYADIVATYRAHIKTIRAKKPATTTGR